MHIWGLAVDVSVGLREVARNTGSLPLRLCEPTVLADAKFA